MKHRSRMGKGKAIELLITVVFTFVMNVLSIILQEIIQNAEIINNYTIQIFY